MRLNCIDSGSLPAGSPLQVARERASESRSREGRRKRRALLSLPRLRAVSLFSWSVEQNARDTQMTTRVTEVPHLAHLGLLSRAALEWLLSTPSSGELPHRLCKTRSPSNLMGSWQDRLLRKKEKKNWLVLTTAQCVLLKKKIKSGTLKYHFSLKRMT